MSQKHSYRLCFCFRRRFKFIVAEAPSEIKTTFNLYSQNGIMDVDQLHRFLVEFQGEEKATKEEAQAIIESQKHVHLFHRNGLNLEAFFRYLFGDLNCPVSPNTGVHHDMTAPLSEYFIYTGHNSYLTGNQISSKCSEAPIIDALQRGVRVIELDMWPNSKKDDVEILHGRTLTAPVALRKCLQSIKDHAFLASPYPVIVTLEDHLTPNLQEKVAKELTQIFGDTLYRPIPESFETLPSPDSLKGKIIISTKPPKDYKRTETELLKTRDGTSQKEGIRSSKENPWGSEISDLNVIDIGSIEKVEQNDHQEEEDMDDIGKTLQQSAEPEYKHLIGIHLGKSKGSIKEALRVDPHKVRRISLSEQKLNKTMIAHGPNVVHPEESAESISQEYACGLIKFQPTDRMTLGAQMVAFNMQGYGRYLWLMHGMFRGNGGCGYIKKPEFLTKVAPNNHVQVFDRGIIQPAKKTLKVRVYMGDGWHLDFGKTDFDLYSPPDFYTRIGIAGVPADSIMQQTRIIQDDWTPIWNQEFEFPLVVPELALLRIEVHEYDMSGKDDFGGQTCLPVSELRTGIRAVPLFNRKGKPLSSVKLLMHFEFV